MKYTHQRSLDPKLTSKVNFLANQSPKLNSDYIDTWRQKANSVLIFSPFAHKRQLNLLIADQQINYMFSCICLVTLAVRLEIMLIKMS